jgi:uncharacterized membrane protein YccC
VTAPAAKPETQEERTQRQLAALRELSDLAVLLARRAAEDAMRAPPEPADKPNRNTPRQHFERLAKCLRDTIALENRIANAKPPAPAAAKPQPADPNMQLDDLSAIGRLYKSPTPNGAKTPWRK